MKVKGKGDLAILHPPSSIPGLPSSSPPPQPATTQSQRRLLAYLDIIPEGDFIGVLSLGASQGSVIEIAAEGVDAEATLDALQCLVENNFSLQEKLPDNSSQTNEIR